MKSSKLIFATAIVALLFIAYGCQQESVLDTTADLPYLSLPENTDFNNLNSYEFRIIMHAFHRLNITTDEDGLEHLHTKYCHEVNVSENVFRYCMNIVINTNEWRINGNIQSRTTRLNPIERPGYGETDCLSYAISNALNISYNEVDTWLIRHFGYDGVPIESIESAICHFNNGRAARMDPSQLPYNASMGANDNTHIGILNDGHAVNICGRYFDTIYFRDYQRSATQIFETNVNNLTQLYHYY